MKKGLATLTIGILLLIAITSLFGNQISASGITWYVKTVDSTGNVGYYTSLAFDSEGNPAISYFDYAQANLKYVHWDGTRWRGMANVTPDIVDNTIGVGTYSSLAFDSSDYPAISYYDTASYNLKYAHWNGTSWITETVDSGGDVGAYSSLAFDWTGKPGISYYDATNVHLKYARWDGTTWVGMANLTPDTVDGTNSVGTYSSLAFDSTGEPSISYCYYNNVTDASLKYVRWDGTTWRGMANLTPDTVDNTAGVGRYTSLAFDALGYAGISYYDFENGRLKYAHWSGSSWDTEVVDTDGVGEFTSLAFDPAGYAGISYHDFENQDLKYAHWSGSIWIKEIIDSSGNVGSHTSLAFDNNGNASISYYDATNGYLKYATTDPTITTPPTASFSASPIEIASGEAVTFTDLSEEATSWQWDFGDGTTPLTWHTFDRPTDGKLSHTYTTVGAYTVSLTVSNPAGSDTQTESITVYTPLKAVFSVPLEAVKGQVVTFTDSSSGEITSWTWDWGDGTTAEWTTRPPGGKFTHTYAREGIYTPSLTVTGPRGSDTTTKLIDVAPAPAWFHLWMIGAIVGGLIVIGGIVFFLIRRRLAA